MSLNNIEQREVKNLALWLRPHINNVEEIRNRTPFQSEHAKQVFSNINIVSETVDCSVVNYMVRKIITAKRNKKVKYMDNSIWAFLIIVFSYFVFLASCFGKEDLTNKMVLLVLSPFIPLIIFLLLHYSVHFNYKVVSQIDVIEQGQSKLIVKLCHNKKCIKEFEIIRFHENNEQFVIKQFDEIHEWILNLYSNYFTNENMQYLEKKYTFI